MNKATLREVAPSKASSLRFSPHERVWHLGLEHIEADTGCIVERFQAPASKAGTSTFTFDEGNVLYSKLRPYLNKVHCPDRPGIATTELVPLRPNQDLLDKKYLAYYLRSPEFLSFISGQVSGAKMPRVNMDTFWNHEIPLPPLEEQKRIAAILDKADALRRKRAEALRLTDDFLQSVFLDMFGPLSPNYRSWPTVTIEQLKADIPNAMRTGPFGSALKHSEFVDSGIAVLGIDNAVSNRFTWAERRYITEEKYDDLVRYTVRPGDVIITIMGTTGRSAVVPEDIPTAISTKHLATITVDRSLIYPEVLSYSIHSHPDVLKQIQTANKGAIMSGLNLGVIRELKLKLPTLLEQERFIKLYREIEQTLARCEASKTEIAILFESLTQRAFRGEL